MTHQPSKHIDKLRDNPVPPLQNEDHLTDAVKKCLYHTLLDLLDTGEQLGLNKNTELLHRMRRAASRMQTQLKLVKKDLPKKTRKRARKRLKKLLKKLDQIHQIDRIMRDLLVQGEGAANRMAVAGIIAQLDAQRLRAKQQLQKFIHSKKYHKFVKGVRKYAVSVNDERTQVKEKKRAKPHQVRHKLPRRLQKRLSQIMAHDVMLDEPDPDWLFGLEKRALQLRNLLESFDPLLGPSNEHYLGCLIRLQEDIEQITNRQRILNFVIRLPQNRMDSAQRAQLKRYRRQLQAQRDQLVKDFPGRWKLFNQQQVMENYYQALLALC